jgi:biopolymer transport protein ExbD
MGMSIGGEGGDAAPMSEINTTPLVDVMLVLLIIFLITIPVAIKSVPIVLPDTRFERTETKAENVQITVLNEGSNCGVYWNGVQKITARELYDRAAAQFKKISDRLGPNVADTDLFPEIHIRGDQATHYRCVGGVISVMQSAGFLKVGFISEPQGPSE